MPRHFCQHCGHDITCSSCDGRGYRGIFPIAVGRGTDEQRCHTCHAQGLVESHACADVFDEFRDLAEAAALPEMLAHPDIEIPYRRRVIIKTVPGFLRVEGAKVRPVFTHHPVLPGQPYNSLIDGLPHYPEHLGDIAYFLLLTSVELVLRTAVERTMSLHLAMDWSAELARVRFDVEETLRRSSTVALHRSFIGEVF